MHRERQAARLHALHVEGLVARAAQVASRRSRSARFTVSIERSMAPDSQNSATIAWETMLGEM